MSSATTVNSSDLPFYDGDKTVFPVWENAVQDKSAMSSSLHPQGLNGFSMSDAEFLANFGIAFAAIDHPGAEPGANQVQAWKIWKNQLDRHELQLTQLNGLKMVILASLGPSCYQLLELPGSGVRTRSVQWIMGELKRVYGTMTASDLEAIITTLETPYVDTMPLRELTRLHAKAHLTSAANGQIINEAAKVRYLVRALAPSGTFKSCIEFWHLQHPTIQAQTFLLLCEALYVFADNRPSTVTSATMGYSANATTNSHTEEHFEARVAAQVKLALAKLKLPAGAAVSDKQYCWSHGPCGHSGVACVHRLPGHKEEATLTNQMGGKAKRDRRNY